MWSTHRHPLVSSPFSNSHCHFFLGYSSFAAARKDAGLIGTGASPEIGRIGPVKSLGMIWDDGINDGCIKQSKGDKNVMKMS